MSRLWDSLAIILVAFLMYECTSSPRFTSSPSGSQESTSAKKSRKSSPPKLNANVRVGQTYVGIASYYAHGFHGKLTANGETFDMYGITAAHKTLPFNTIVRVTNLENDRSILVRINDRGPFIPGRMLDLSYGAAKKLGILGPGTAKVKMEIVELGDNEYAR
ncbi:MAG: Endolytic peptidoglycan transglycosylase RlpA [Candidatus Marinimicrobia bacterium]|nr:Endolytic peptidoglycan transglycosylase RlpA [Candidatus Neomarinimicrobiota bacterium]